jgi:hypothetical protein
MLDWFVYNFPDMGSASLIFSFGVLFAVAQHTACGLKIFKS